MCCCCCCFADKRSVESCRTSCQLLTFNPPACGDDAEKRSGHSKSIRIVDWTWSHFTYNGKRESTAGVDWNTQKKKKAEVCWHFHSVSISLFSFTMQQLSLDEATDPWGVKVERVEMWVCHWWTNNQLQAVIMHKRRREQLSTYVSVNFPFFFNILIDSDVTTQSIWKIQFFIASQSSFIFLMLQQSSVSFTARTCHCQHNFKEPWQQKLKLQGESTIKIIARFFFHFYFILNLKFTPWELAN